jgi:hypothetical protein
MNRSTKMLLLLAPLLLTVVSYAMAAPNRLDKRGEFYFGPVFAHSSLTGDFDGERAEIGPNDIFLVPKLSSANGFGGLIGFRFYRKGIVDPAMEVSYLQSNHKSTVVGQPMEDAKYRMVNLDVKGYFMPTRSLQPFVVAGICLPWMTVPNSDLQLNDSGHLIGTNEAKFSGLGFNLGGGLSWYVLPMLSLDGSAIYRLKSFNMVNEKELEDSLSSNDLDFMASLTLHFGI